MALFSRGLYNADPSFTPLFRLLSDFDNYTREIQGEQDGSGHHKHRGHTRLITPKFDFHETKDTYELHGELPGIERDNVVVEFPDPQTLLIRGHVERTYSSGTPPAGLLKNKTNNNTITEQGEEHHGHKVTVEDEESAAAKKAAEGTQVVKHDKDKEQKAKQSAEPTEKFWVSERSFGQFERTFTFPTRVDHDAVSANLTNGVLNISIPKVKKQEARRIAIN